MVLMNSMPHRWEAEPSPAFPYVTLALLALTYARNSLKSFAGSSFFATSVIGTSVTSPIGSKSRIESYGSFR